MVAIAEVPEAVATAATHTIFAGPARCLGIYMVQPKNLAASTVTIQDDSTAVAIFNLPATDDSSNKGADVTKYEGNALTDEVVNTGNPGSTRGIAFQVFGDQNKAGLIPDFRFQDKVQNEKTV